jgi:hypothetical protein
MKNILFILIFSSLIISSCKKDPIMTDLKLVGNYYENNDSSAFLTINSVAVRKWGLTLSGDTNTLDAVININIPEDYFYDQNINNPKTKVECIFYLNGKAHYVKYTDGVYSLNNFFSQMKNKENTLIVNAKLLERNNEMKRVSNIYKFRIN